MATKVHMEALSPTMEEGQVVKWLKSEGESVSSGEVLAEVETDKATMELVARGDGVLRKILVGEGTSVPVGEVIAVIAGADEDIAGLVADAAAPSNGGRAAAATPEATSGEPAAPTVPSGDVPAEATHAGGRVKASPLARRMASERGLDLGAIPGSGPRGRVVKRDVEAAAETVTPPVAAPLPAFGQDEDDYVDVPLTQIRKTIARRLTESLGPVPHFFLTIDVDMGRAMEARRAINGALEGNGIRVSVNDLVLKATAAALRAHPACNAWWQQGGAIRRFNRVHLGVAVAVDDGLITPVVRDAHLKGLARISQEVREMAARAQQKKLQPEEYTGSTFSVSNLGMFGIEEFTAVINPPEAGILAIGAVEERPVVQDGQVVVRTRMKITMSCDHRVIDGAQGSRFLATLKTYLEEPAAILI